MRALFAQIDKVDNGYVVKYPEAVKEVRPLPNPYDVISDAQISLFVNLHGLATDEDDEWSAAQREQREQRIRERLAKLRQEHSGRTIEVWVLKENEYICVGLDGIREALQAAESARAQIKALQEQGTQIISSVALSGVPGAHMG